MRFLRCICGISGANSSDILVVCKNLQPYCLYMASFGLDQALALKFLFYEKRNNCEQFHLQLFLSVGRSLLLSLFLCSADTMNEEKWSHRIEIKVNFKGFAWGLFHRSCLRCLSSMSFSML